MIQDLERNAMFEGFSDIIDSIFNSFSNPLNLSKPQKLVGEESPATEGERGENRPSLERNEEFESGAPGPLGDSQRLEWLDGLPRAISEAMNLTMLPKLEEIIRTSTECCAKISESIDPLTNAIEAMQACCKATAEAPSQDISKQIDQIEKEIREATRLSPLDQVSIIDMISGWIAKGVALRNGMGLLFGNLLGTWVAMEFAHLGEVFRRLNADPSDLKNWSAERIEGREELNSRYPESQGADDSILDAFSDQAWREWQRALRELLDNIESSDTGHDAQKLREDSLRVLPDVVEDIQRAMELHRDRHDGQDAPLDRELLDKAIDLLHGAPPAPEEPQPAPDLEPGVEDGSDLMSRRHGAGVENEAGLLSTASYSTHDGRAVADPHRIEALMEAVLARLQQPVRLEISVLDDRVSARRLDGNRGVSVDLSRGYRLVGYVSI